VRFYTFFGTKGSLRSDTSLLLWQRDRGTLENQLIILVVEDDQFVQSVVVDCLSDGGFEAVIASSGEEAVELLDAADGKYRALVTDINLSPSKIDGWHIARHARDSDPNFPVVYMSGRDGDDWAVKGVPNSIMLPKPFASAQLVTAISQLLNSGTTSGFAT
jgi:DNA-binding response OmpR family regulator